MVVAEEPVVPLQILTEEVDQAVPVVLVILMVRLVEGQECHSQQVAVELEETHQDPLQVI